MTMPAIKATPMMASLPTGKTCSLTTSSISRSRDSRAVCSLVIFSSSSTRRRKRLTYRLVSSSESPVEFDRFLCSRVFCWPRSNSDFSTSSFIRFNRSCCSSNFLALVFSVDIPRLPRSRTSLVRILSWLPSPSTSPSKLSSMDLISDCNLLTWRWRDSTHGECSANASMRVFWAHNRRLMGNCMASCLIARRCCRI